MSEALYIALNFELPAADAEWWLILPAGRFSGRDGRTWNNSDPDAVVRSFNRQKRDAPIDEEHSTEIKGPKGEEARARGYIKQLEVRNGEVWGQVDINPVGRKLLDNAEYRYYSPAFDHNKAGVVFSLSSVALTNKNNLNLPALNREHKEDTEMDKLAIIAALGLASDASESNIVDSINALKSDRQTALNRAEAPSLDKYVPTETYELALNRATTAEQKLVTRDAEVLEEQAEALVGQAIDEHKISVGNKNTFMSMCRAKDGIKHVTEFLEKAPKIIEVDETLAGKTPKASDKSKLTEFERALCRDMGQSTEEYLATRDIEQREQDELS